MAKKPIHDPATAWNKPDPAQGSGAPFTAEQVYQAYANYYQALRVYPPGGGTPAASGKLRWVDVPVGKTLKPGDITWGGITVRQAQFADAYYEILYEFSDGSEGRYDSLLGRIKKTSAATPPTPVPTPEDIEETTEVIVGWRVFSVRDYKLRGTWNTWEGRVFHASCNCKEFEEGNNLASSAALVMEFHVQEERREQMRRHLAAGTGTCGVYSRKTLNPFWHPGNPHYQGYRVGRRLEVVARCVNYGLGYEYSEGYRSEYCRIEHLWLLGKEPLTPDLSSGQLVVSLAALVGYEAETISPATVAQLLATTYGVPCDVMTPLEFAYKNEEGLL